MNRQKLIGITLVILGVLLVLGSAYAILSYAGNVLNAMLDFVTTNDMAALQRCGVNMPERLASLKYDITSVLLPALYLGIPLMLVILSLLMFFGGYYYHQGKHRELIEKRRMSKALTK